MPDRNEFKRAKSRAFKYLSYRDRSRHEMADYLAKKGFSRDIVEETILYLKNLNYINDERFVLNWGKARIKSKRVGKQRLRQELLGKGVAEKEVSRALHTLYSDIDEFQLAQSCVEKKSWSFRNIDADTKKRRIAQFLQRKGFPGDIILKIIKQ